MHFSFFFSFFLHFLLRSSGHPPSQSWNRLSLAKTSPTSFPFGSLRTRTSEDYHSQHCTASLFPPGLRTSREPFLTSREALLWPWVTAFTSVLGLNRAWEAEVLVFLDPSPKGTLEFCGN